MRSPHSILNQNNGDKMLAVGRYMANDAGVHGVVEEILRYPNGTVIATVRRTHSSEPGAMGYILLQGDLVGEVL